jgi:hypothetical protein
LRGRQIRVGDAILMRKKTGQQGITIRRQGLTDKQLTEAVTF